MIIDNDEVFLDFYILVGVCLFVLGVCVFFIFSFGFFSKGWCLGFICEMKGVGESSDF